MKFKQKYTTIFCKKKIIIIMSNIKYLISLIVILIRVSFLKVYPSSSEDLSRSLYYVILYNRSQLCLTNVGVRDEH